MPGKTLLTIELFSTGTTLLVAGVLFGRATQMIIQDYFSSPISDNLINIGTLPFFVVGGVLIVEAVGMMIIYGDR